MYKCCRCQVTLPKESFRSNKGRHNGLSSYCKDCSKLATQEYRSKNTETYLLKRAKERAKAKGIECTITEEDIVIPEFCPVFNFKLQINNDKWTSPSIDRIDNNLGYIQGNIRVISYRANMLRHTGTLEEFEMLTNYLRNNK